jgi:hypothetical protein
MNKEERELVESAITGTFMWSFKKGDNIVYNFEILWELYRARSAAQAQKQYYNKPITLLIVAIMECIFDDFINRVGQHVYDKIPNLTSKEISLIRAKKLDKLDHYISIAKKYNLFDRDTSFYDTLDFLRRVRNRFHIQNTLHQLDSDESKVFTASTRIEAEKAFEIILEIMMVKFPRKHSHSISFNDVPLPWKVFP